MTDLVLHLGAHKTATTWLQTRLEAGLPTLRGLGVDYEPLGPFRIAFADKLDVVMHHGATPARMAELRGAMEAYLSRGARRFIASDENIIGQCNPIVNGGRLYPSFKARLEMLSRLLPAPPVMTVFTIRNYAPFFGSVYCESLWHGRYNSFDEFRGRLVIGDGLWLKIVGELVAAFGADRVRILRYETLASHLPELLRLLCGQAVDPGELPESSDRRERLSTRVVEELGRIAEQTDRITARRKLGELVRRFPTPDFPPFDPWTAEERARLDALYADHVAQIGSRWPGVLL